MMVRLSSLALAGALLFNSLSTTNADSTAAASGFSASDGSVFFALNIPDNSTDNDLYFSLLADASQSWVAIGMGSNKMEHSLMWMVYKDKSGKNITLSPRLSGKHVEPSYTSNVSVTILPGTGIIDGNYTLFARCTNCRSWKGGSIDPTNMKAPFIFATGPAGDLNTNDLSAGIKRHAEYGVFTMNLTLASGTAGAPAIVTADTTGTVQTKDDIDHDFSSAAHACIMILAFVGLMPLGFLILRVLNSPKWHAVNQSFAALVALIGMAIGISISTMYNRSKNFNSPHQILGLIIILFLITQVILGYLHHRIYKRTSLPTKFAPIHIWLGRLVIPLGIINAFLGFPLALNSKFNWALLALVLLIIILVLPFMLWRMKRKANKKPEEAAGGYQERPWEQRSDGSNLNLNPYPPPANTYAGQSTSNQQGGLPPYENSGWNQQYQQSYR